MTTHIRPKIKSRKGTTAVASDVDVLIEQTRQKMKLFSATNANAVLISNNDFNTPLSSNETDSNKKIDHDQISTSSSSQPKGILKTSTKYTGSSSLLLPKSTDSSKDTHTMKEEENDYFHKFEHESLASELGLSRHHELMNSDAQDGQQPDSRSVKPFVKDFVMERKVGIPIQNTNEMKNFNSISIEGHDTKINTCTESYSKSEEETLDTPNDMKIIGSLSELVAYAQETSQRCEEQVTSIETDLDFSCYTKEQYDEISESAKALGMTLDEYLQHRQVASEDDEKDDYDDIDELKESVATNIQDNDSEDMTSITNEDEEDDFVDIFGSVLDEEYLPPPPIRPFMMIWNALSMWITPNAVLVLRTFKTDMFDNHDRLVPDETADPMTHRIEMSDVASSRAAGLMSMLKMNLNKSLTELGYSNDGYTRRLAETRLSEFLQCFDYSQPMVKFHSDLWRALTIVLLDIVLPKYDIAYEGQSGKRISHPENLDDNAPLLAFMNGIGISKDEYKYLVTKAIPSLDLGAF